MLKILIVDDSKGVHAFIKSLLSKVTEEIKLIGVFNGEEALAKLSTDKDFDIIFLDWEMPVLDGPSTLKKFSEVQNKIPVIMMTTKNSPTDIGVMLQLGASEYMLKPFTLDIMSEKLEAVTGKRIPCGN